MSTPDASALLNAFREACPRHATLSASLASLRACSKGRSLSNCYKNAGKLLLESGVANLARCVGVCGWAYQPDKD
eukprot:353336-Chlamydomonas_euryale.AAC.1